MKPFWWFLIKPGMVLPYNLAVTLFGIDANELKTYIHIKACPHIRIAVLSLVAKTWKQPGCPSGGKWVNKYDISRQE